MDNINIYTSETFLYKKANVKFLTIDRMFVNMSLTINKELIQVQTSIYPKVGLDIQLETIYQELIKQAIKYLNDK